MFGDDRLARPRLGLDDGFALDVNILQNVASYHVKITDEFQNEVTKVHEFVMNL